MSHARPLHVVLFAGVLVSLLWSAVAPRDRLTWWLEVSWVILGLPVVYATRQRAPFTDISYVALAAHAVILVIGGKYTYEHVPLGTWLRDALDLTRNPYDRIGHFAQGFVPAVWGRELLLRLRVVNGRAWLFVIVSGLCLAFSALFELLEWWAALAFGADADGYLATQGDRWDTQWDMFACLCGAIVAQVLTARAVARALARRYG